LQAATAARPIVPVVMLANNYNPFERGYVRTLAQPGGNVTGLFYRQQELAAKQLELLIEAFPEPRRIAVLWDSISEDTFHSAEKAAQSMGLSLGPLKLENPPYDFDAAFQMLAQGNPKAVLVLSSPLFTPQRIRIAELAIKHRLPTMFIFKTYVEAGGLMSYGVDLAVMYQRAATYVAKILRGAHPTDLPVDQADNFHFALNLKKAKALGLTPPTSILLRADEVKACRNEGAGTRGVEDQGVILITAAQSMSASFRKRSKCRDVRRACRPSALVGQNELIA